MDFDLILKPIVYWDIDESIVWYEKKIKGLGLRFLQSFEEVIVRIVDNPYSFSYLKKPVRKAKIKRFPYRVIYVINDHTIYILGVINVRRSNRFIKKRARLP
ncbi:type II toxin-antitoxin system RelE/ParE family toxin [Agriterribacter sp.]|uniref:type II toxin-antitoxin system RelE/ParE family toxin n=1 Tax=Agriterribacter sp. TaxID=2821509 RepID=UPI002C793C7A|nr:type II toxin-antitoxin system RelE/ParE family toxin [Agriterribacter sp.]HRO45307.1 type II toxin-antitoxin system RelE/ParE family toxin [Agriterribacter sp.]HRQ17132.1 type II toxin-antitoxin system RelE/ParE family toxin [Agriterribacter sp.]